MAEAIALARKAEGRTHPNPLVGSVIVRGDEVLGRGYHQRAGTDHAEVAAIKDAREKGHSLEGAELYVNHEPCCHFGRTPPCTSAILEAKIGRVVVGTIDPDPRVSGRGLELLRSQGVEVQYGILEEESRALNAPFFTYINKCRPFVAAKWAMSLDGKIATSAGDSRWITSEEARQKGHELRNRHDAILVGTRTLVLDDPRLTCRLDEGRDPARFVIDARLEAPLTHQIFHLSSPAPTIVLTGPESPFERRKELEGLGVEVEVLGIGPDRWLSTASILEAIYRRQYMSVLVEGGGAILGSLFDGNWVDYVYAFLAPQILGGTGSTSPVGGKGVARVNASHRIDAPRWEPVGRDFLLHGPLRGAAPLKEESP